MDGLRALVSDPEHLNHGVTRADLETLLMLRDEFRGFFVSCSQGSGTEAAARLNELLIQYPVHPQLSGHDGQAWHVHYTESGSMSDKYAAGAAMGLAVRLADLGLDRFGVCQAAPCQGVFVDTSVNRTRRYCSDRCASRANVTAYRARKRGEDGEQGSQATGPNGHRRQTRSPAARECFHTSRRPSCLPRMRLPQTIWLETDR